MPPRVSSSLLLVLLVHALWGGLPFCCRYLLVYASPPLHSATLLASARALSVLVLAAFSYVPGTTCYRVSNSETLLAAMSFPSLASPSSENLLPTNRSFATFTSSKTTYKLRASRLKMAFFFGWFTAISHLMNVLSCYVRASEREAGREQEDNRTRGRGRSGREAYKVERARAKRARRSQDGARERREREDRKVSLLLLLLFCGGSGQARGLSGGDPPNPPAAGEVALVLGRTSRSPTCTQPHMCSAAHAPSP
jgi:hypothetical protein